jgi:hypothetical protein
VIEGLSRSGVNENIGAASALEEDSRCFSGDLLKSLA